MGIFIRAFGFEIAICKPRSIHVILLNSILIFKSIFKYLISFTKRYMGFESLTEMITSCSI